VVADGGGDVLAAGGDGELCGVADRRDGGAAGRDPLLGLGDGGGDAG